MSILSRTHGQDLVGVFSSASHHMPRRIASDFQSRSEGVARLVSLGAPGPAKCQPNATSTIQRKVRTPHSTISTSDVWRTSMSQGGEAVRLPP